MLVTIEREKHFYWYIFVFVSGWLLRNEEAIKENRKIERLSSDLVMKTNIFFRITKFSTFFLRVDKKFYSYKTDI